MDKAYWSDRWAQGQTGWDMGQVSPPIKRFIDQDLHDKQLRILIPGCGSAYEGAYLHKQGFENVYLLDIAQQPLDHFSTQYPDFPTSHLICQDFFDLDLTFDLIVEQTFFCALDPALRNAYAKHTAKLLAPEGRLAGLLFATVFDKQGPPFGGTSAGYRELFSPYFEIKKMEPCRDSISPRLGSELWIEFVKK